MSISDDDSWKWAHNTTFIVDRWQQQDTLSIIRNDFDSKTIFDIQIFLLLLFNIQKFGKERIAFTIHNVWRVHWDENDDPSILERWIYLHFFCMLCCVQIELTFFSSSSIRDILFIQSRKNIECNFSFQDIDEITNHPWYNVYPEFWWFHFKTSEMIQFHILRFIERKICLQRIPCRSSSSVTILIPLPSLDIVIDDTKAEKSFVESSIVNWKFLKCKEWREKWAIEGWYRRPSTLIEVFQLSTKVSLYEEHIWTFFLLLILSDDASSIEG